MRFRGIKRSKIYYLALVVTNITDINFTYLKQIDEAVN
jgi:hypothetical protein